MHEKSLSHMLQGTLPQVTAVLVVTIVAVSDGMHYGWTAPVLKVIEDLNGPIHLTQSDYVWLETVYLIGGLTGLPVTISAVDRIGRKGSILLSAVIALISWLLIGIADRVEYLYVARFIVGLSGDITFVAAPMYIAEIADTKIRGFLSGIVYIMLLLGILVIYSIAPYAPFYVPSIIGATLVGIQIITLPFIPDSPYYLLSKNQQEKAKLHLQRLRGTNSVEKELAEISTAAQRQQSEKGRPQDLFLSKSNRKAVLIMFVLNGAAHFAGMTVMMMNLHEILQAADSIYFSKEIAGIIFAALMMISSTIADFIVDKFGRKALLTSSSLLTSLCLLILAVFFTLKSNEVNVEKISWIPLVAVMGYAAVLKLGLGIVPVVMTVELFPAEVKAVGITISDFFYLFFAWMSVEIYKRLTIHVGNDVPFYFFSSCCILTAIFVQFYVPETNGKSLEEIQFILKGMPAAPIRSNSVRSPSNKTPDE